MNLKKPVIFAEIADIALKAVQLFVPIVAWELEQGNISAIGVGIKPIHLLWYVWNAVYP